MKRKFKLHQSVLSAARLSGCIRMTTSQQSVGFTGVSKACEQSFCVICPVPALPVHVATSM